jgi:hypothetical protein
MAKTIDVRLVSTSTRPEIVKLTIDGVEYVYETSYYHIEKFKAIYRHSPVRALAHIKKNSSAYRKTGRVINWEVTA